MEAAHRHPATIAEGHITIPLPTRLVTRTMAQITTPAVTIVEAETAVGVTEERVDRLHTNFLFPFAGAPLPLFATTGSLGLRIQHIRTHGIKFPLGPFEGSGCSIAVIADPNGNKIGIHKRK